MDALWCQPKLFTERQAEEKIIDLQTQVHLPPLDKISLSLEALVTLVSIIIRRRQG